MMKKSLAKNSIYNVIYKGFTALFPLITTAYISRVLLADGVGKVSYASTVVSYFAIIAALGLPQYGVKIIASNYTKEERSIAFTELFLINLCSTTICIFAYYMLINFWDYFIGKRTLLNIMGIQLILNIFNIDWFYQGIEEYGYITTRSIVIKILSFLAMLVFVKNSSDYIVYGFILCMATASNNILNVRNLRGRIKISLDGINIKQHLGPVIILLASALATEIYTMLDTVMIEHFCGDAYVGYYSNSVKIVRLVHTLSIALVAPFYPRISYYLKEKEHDKFNNLMTVGLKSILVISIPCVLGIEVLSDKIVPVLFGSSFMEAIATLRILSPLILIFSVAYFLGHIVLLATNNESRILVVTIVGAIVNFGINYVLIPIYNQNGAAVASVTAELLITILLIVFSQKYYKLEISRRFTISMVVSSIVMCAVVYAINLIDIGKLAVLILAVVIGATSYFICQIALKNDSVLMIADKLLKRVKRPER